jgi:2-hydroxy-3-oxopropionate reductase
MAIGGALASVAEALALARKAGVDAGQVRQALLGGFASSRVLEVHGERMLTSAYAPGFKTKLYHKDLRIAAETLSAHNVSAPTTAVVMQLVNASMAAGDGELDNSALAKVVFALASLPS